jgi:hypothetical protein
MSSIYYIVRVKKGGEGSRYKNAREAVAATFLAMLSQIFENGRLLRTDRLQP